MVYIQPFALAAVWDSEGSQKLSFDCSHSSMQSIIRQMGFEPFGKIVLRDRIEDMIESRFENAFDFSDHLSSNISPSNHPKTPNLRSFYSSDNAVIFPSTVIPNHYVLCGNSKTEVNSEIHRLEDSLNEWDDNPFHQVGRLLEEPNIHEIEFKLIHGEEYANIITRTISDQGHINPEFDNRFEEKVYAEITDRITGCVTSNADLRVGEESNENREYDLLIHLSPTSRIYVEVKSTLSARVPNANPDWKHSLIGKPFEYTAVLDRVAGTYSPGSLEKEYGQTECFVIVDDIDGEIHSGLQEIAADRDIKLLERDSDLEYLEEIRNSLVRMLDEFTEPVGEGVSLGANHIRSLERLGTFER